MGFISWVLYILAVIILHVLQHVTRVVHCRGTETVYRIVGFEVDPRSVAKGSFRIKSEQESKPVEVAKTTSPGTKCALPQEVAVAELRKGS